MNKKEQKIKEKQRLHERLLDAEDALLITCEGNEISIDILGCLLNVGEGLSYVLAQNTDLADFFLSVIGGSAAASIDMGEIKKSKEFENALKGVLLYLSEAKGKTHN